MHQVPGTAPPPPPKGWGQIFRLLPSPPQGRDACAYAYTTSYAYICVHMLAHVCTCRHMYAHMDAYSLFVCFPRHIGCMHMYAYACIWMHIHQ